MVAGTNPFAKQILHGFVLVTMQVLNSYELVIKYGLYDKEAKNKMSESLKGRVPWNKGKPSPYRRKVYKYDLNGNFIKEYDCIKSAVKENPKSSHIKDVCRGIRKQAGGFIWKYA